MVKWKGYSEAKSTWEPIGNLENCHQIIEEFERLKPKGKGGSKPTAVKTVKFKEPVKEPYPKRKDVATNFED